MNPRRMVRSPITVNAMASAYFGKRNFHLLWAIRGMKNMAGSVPIPKAVMEAIDEAKLPLDNAFVNPRYTSPHGSSPFANPKEKER